MKVGPAPLDKEADLRELLYLVSHDFSAPLRGIVEFSRILKAEAPELGAEQLTYLQIILESGEQMQIMLAALIDYLMIGSEPLQKRPVDMTNVLEACGSQLKDKIGASKASLIVRNLPVVDGDEAQLTSLCYQILANALHAGFRERPLQIEVAAEKGPDGVTIVIRDNGRGMVPAYIAEALKPFKRLHADGREAGTGMGLAIAKKIVERHGGTLEIFSQPAEGTTVRINLPS